MTGDIAGAVAARDVLQRLTEDEPSPAARRLDTLLDTCPGIDIVELTVRPCASDCSFG